MKKLGRKRSAASVISEKSSESNLTLVNKNAKQVLQSTGQTKISAFFSKAPAFTSIKETSTSSENRSETTTAGNISKHVNNFKRRLSLGNKKIPNIHSQDTTKKLVESVQEEDELVDVSSEIKAIVKETQNSYANVDMIIQENVYSSKPKGCQNSFSKSPGRMGYVTSTPNKSPLDSEEELANTSRSLIRKSKYCSIAGNIVKNTLSNCEEPEKRQKMSNSIEEIYPENVADVSVENFNSKDATKIIKRNKARNMCPIEDAKEAEFEFESSVINASSFSKKGANLIDQETPNKVTKMQKLCINEALDCSDDNNAIAEAFKDDSFSMISPNAKSNCDSKQQNDLNKDIDAVKDLDSKPLSFYYGRHIVKSVEHDPTWGDIRLEVTRDANDVKLKDREPEKLQQIILRGSWTQSTKVKKGSIVNILNVTNKACENAEGPLVIDDVSEILVVVNPDRLISGTSIVSTLFCMRKAVLSEWYKGLESTNRTMFIGTLLHEVLQQSLKKNLNGPNQIIEQLNASMGSLSIMQDMLTLKLTPTEIRKEVEPFLSHIEFFIKRYLLGENVSVPSPAFGNPSTESQKGRRLPDSPEIWQGRVDEIRDIEENIWSPRLGIKGKVDLTLHVNLPKKDKKGRIRKTLPLELKTGRPSGSAEHRGQVILYTMIMSERWPDPDSGLLLYLRNSSITEVQAGVHEIRGLVQLRNQLVHYITGFNDSEPTEDHRNQKEPDLPELPDPINLKRACEQCSQLKICTLYQKLGNQVQKNPKHAMNELVPQSTNHLTEKELRFFTNHSIMAQLEASEGTKFSRLKNLWCNTPMQREAMGNAIANLQLKLVKSHVHENIHVAGSKHVFEKLKPIEEIISKTTFNVGELVIVGTESMIALTQGTVHSVNESQIVVILDRDLHHLKVLQEKSDIFHIDRYEYSSGSSFNLVNLAKLMSNENPIATNLRRIVVDQGKDTTFLKGLPKEVATSSKAKAILRPLNRVQQKAVFRVMMAEQFVLLEGMPGCGKTTVIVALIRLLLTLGKTVLLTSYTHSAVDNVLLKMIEKEKLQPELATPFIRLGKSSRINPLVYAHSAERSLTLDPETDNLQNKFDNLYQSMSFVATTCLGVNHPAITTKQQPFDYCILDEAGQCLMLSALGPLFHAKKFVLVGDPHQLPPLVQSQKAKRKGMDISLFSHLSSKPENIIPLTMQYRMNEKIQALANYLTYEGRLECGSEEVAKQTIKWTSNPPIGDEPQWIMRTLDTDSIENSLIFLNTDSLDNAMETTCDLGLYNPGEGNIVQKICSLVQNMSPPGTNRTPDIVKQETNKLTIGVIAPYRAQVMHLRNRLTLTTTNASIDVNTVDQFQGQDKDIIIYSCTRSTPQKIRRDNEEKKDRDRVDIMCDKRRLNVAITRAKCKLIILGNARALQSYEPYQRLLNFLQETGNVLPIQTKDI